ncbi:hypothetical protein [Kitasatospora fiedleri]|uniref:hypothetical protein n=1 Tax=Kitasatospora fiedleri TaxID=2991545 RepID=UPI00249A35FF|nr:hypothetical protein [Kitasatospora fiedleri]
MTTPADHPDFAAVLAARSMLPADPVALFVAGSLIQGWGNPRSDYDIYVITRAPWQTDRTVAHPVPLTPATFHTDVLHEQGRSWEVRYWQADQIDQILAKTAWEGTLETLPPASRLGVDESVLLQRLPHALAVHGADWVAERARRAEQSAARAMFIVRALDYADGSVDDAVGQLEIGDVHSAVLSARRAFDFAVDALLASHGHYGESPKWRARRFRAVRPAALSFDAYWSVETMRGYDSADPAAWVLKTTRLAKDLLLDTRVY